MRKYKTEKVMAGIAKAHNLRPKTVAKIEPAVKDICETVNADLGYSMMRPYSHNVISLGLQSIARQFDTSVANTVIDLVPMIEHSYQIHKIEE